MTEARRRAQNNAARGKAFEQRLARRTGGAVYTGQAGDVEAHGYRVEAKHSVALRGYGKLRQHIEQAIDNGREAGKPWALALTGGKTFHNDQVFVLMPLEEWLRLLEGVTREGTVVVEPGRWGRIREAAADLHKELYGD